MIFEDVYTCRANIERESKDCIRNHENIGEKYHHRELFLLGDKNGYGDNILIVFHFEKDNDLLKNV